MSEWVLSFTTSSSKSLATKQSLRDDPASCDSFLLTIIDIIILFAVYEIVVTNLISGGFGNMSYLYYVLVITCLYVKCGINLLSSLFETSTNGRR